MKKLISAILIGGTIIAIGMNTRPYFAIGGEWLLGLTIIWIGLLLSER